ncbi:MAG: hypothetical protein ABSE00_04175 [Chitinispirillaceae bacterium]|jgi:hypothetical protein
MASKQTICLIYGNPDNGKSALAQALCAGCNFKVISLDREYVSFVYKRYPELYFACLYQVIGRHYDHIVSGVGRIGEDLKREWQEHIGILADDGLKINPRLAIEGYLLNPTLQPNDSTIVAVERRLRLEKSPLPTIIKVNAPGGRTYQINYDTTPRALEYIVNYCNKLCDPSPAFHDGSK